MAVFYIGPMLASLYYSFTNYPIIGSPTWTGLANYRALTTDAQFTTALKVSLIYTVGAVALYVLGGLGLALLCNHKAPGVGIVRAVIFLPSLVPVFAMAMIWGMVFNEDFGPANNVLHSLGIAPQGWFQSQSQALPLGIAISFWTLGTSFVVFLAGLQSVPNDMYEAITVDGANVFWRFWHVTLPMLSPVILFNLVIGIINSFQAFDLDWALTSGGPGNATLFYVYQVWRDAFQDFEMGYASALAWVLFLIIVAITILIFRTGRYWVHYEGQVR
jgi:multiple sugar transport system permease protein